MQFPAVIDNTTLKALRRCPHYCMQRHFEGLKPNDESDGVDLVFGAAFAAGIQAGRKAYFEEGHSASEAVDLAAEAATKTFTAKPLLIPARSSKTYANLVLAVRYYFLTAFPLQGDPLQPVTNGIECEFKRELPFLHPDTGKPLLYAGRMDMLAKDVTLEGLVVVDEKTTSNFSDGWLAQWDTDPQMSGYIWATGASHAIIRGIAVSSKCVTHTTVPVWRTQHQLDVWERAMLNDVDRMLTLYRYKSEWNRYFGSACNAYGRQCEYVRLCLSPNAEQIVKENYRVEFWNPLTTEKEAA